MAELQGISGTVAAATLAVLAKSTENLSTTQHLGDLVEVFKDSYNLNKSPFSLLRATSTIAMYDVGITASRVLDSVLHILDIVNKKPVYKN